MGLGLPEGPPSTVEARVRPFTECSRMSASAGALILLAWKVLETVVGSRARRPQDAAQNSGRLLGGDVLLLKLGHPSPGQRPRAGPRLY